MSMPPHPESELIVPDGTASHLPSESAAGPDESEDGRESVAQPAKVMRVGSMIRQLLDEAHNTTLDEVSRQRLGEIYARSVEELADALSPDLREELDRLAFPFLQRPEADGVPSEAELRIAQAQLIGWLEGLFHGIQATLFAQQMAARQQLEQMRGQLPRGEADPAADARPGTYL
jgi:hypothetical protein